MHASDDDATRMRANFTDLAQLGGQGWLTGSGASDTARRLQAYNLAQSVQAAPSLGGMGEPMAWDASLPDAGDVAMFASHLLDSPGCSTGVTRIRCDPSSSLMNISVYNEPQAPGTSAEVNKARDTALGTPPRRLRRFCPRLVGDAMPGSSHGPLLEAHQHRPPLRTSSCDDLTAAFTQRQWREVPTAPQSAHAGARASGAGSRSGLSSMAALHHGVSQESAAAMYTSLRQLNTGQPADSSSAVLRLQQSQHPQEQLWARQQHQVQDRAGQWPPIDQQQDRQWQRDKAQQLATWQHQGQRFARDPTTQQAVNAYPGAQ